MLINYGTLNMILNRINVMSWTANIIIILVITVHRLSVIYCPLKRSSLFHARVVAATCCVVSAGYALYPTAMGISSSSCGDRKAFLIREVCTEIERENVKFGELTGEQQVNVLLLLSLGYCG